MLGLVYLPRCLFLLLLFYSAYQPRCGWFGVPGFQSNRKGTVMTRFASKNASSHGRRGRQRSYQHAEAHHIRQDRQLTVALHTMQLVNQMHEGGR